MVSRFGRLHRLRGGGRPLLYPGLSSPVQQYAAAAPHNVAQRAWSSREDRRAAASSRSMRSQMDLTHLRASSSRGGGIDPTFDTSRASCDRLRDGDR